MKKIISSTLAVCLIVIALAVPASAALYDGWHDLIDRNPRPVHTFPLPVRAVSEPVEISESAPEVEVQTEYSIRYDANGGYWWSQYASPALSTTKKYTVEAGESHTIISAPIRTGYVFQGWQAADGTIYQPGAKITPAENMTFKALWG